MIDTYTLDKINWDELADYKAALVDMLDLTPEEDEQHIQAFQGLIELIEGLEKDHKPKPDKDITAHPLQGVHNPS